MSKPIFLFQAIAQTPGAKRQELVQAIRDGNLHSDSTEAPWMVTLADVQAYVKDNPALFPVKS